MKNTNRPRGNLSARLSVRYTPSEVEAIKAKAARMGLKPSQLVHDASLSLKIRDLSEETRQARLELLRQGNNLNQIAYRLNAGMADAQVMASLTNTINLLNTVYEKIGK